MKLARIEYCSRGANYRCTYTLRGSKMREKKHGIIVKIPKNFNLYCHLRKVELGEIPKSKL